MLEQLNELGVLAEGTRMFTMDATAMYTNIDTDHGMKILEMFIDMFADEISPNYPKELLLLAMNIVMRMNVFEFGRDTFRQLDGTAMGTPSACMYATIYYAFHEITVLLKKYEQHLTMYKRLIDDGFGIWNDCGDPSAWERFCYDVNHFPGGKLQWTIEERSREVNFLDITITINELNQIETRTYQKPMNLYLYITASSAHAKGVLKGMIYGELRRYKLQNSKREDYLQMVRSFYDRLRARGHEAAVLYELFMEAANKIESGYRKVREEVKPRERLFLHMKYHPSGISRRQLREAFDKTCGNFEGSKAEVKQVTVAFSRATNLKDELTSARFYPPAEPDLAPL